MLNSLYEGAYGTYARVNYSRLWQSRLMSSVSFDEVFTGDLIWAATKGVFLADLVGILTVVAGWLPLQSFVIFQPVLILAALMLSAVGVSFAAFSATFEQLPQLIALFMTPMLGLCGVYFPRDNMPEVLRQSAAVLPLSPLLDLLRFQLGVELVVPKLLWCLALTIVSVLTARWALRRRLFPA